MIGRALARARAGVLLALVVTLAGGVSADDATPPPAAAAGGGFLFSAIPLASTPLAGAWSPLRAEALARFPHLELTLAEDLHVTVVYLGEWRPADLPRLRSLALVAPAAPVRLAPRVARFGRAGTAVVIELEAASADWPAAVVAAKAELNRLGLKRADSYDESFRPHVTLARSQSGKTTVEESAELAAFEAWMGERVAADPASFTPSLGPDTAVRFLVAGTTRPDGAPRYVPVEELLTGATTAE